MAAVGTVEGSLEPGVIEAGDFSAFYAATFHALTVQLYAHTSDLSEAQDVVQEAFCRALTRWSTVSTYDDPAAWVRKVAWNLATSRWRRLRRAASFSAGYRVEHAEGPGPDRVALLHALASLPDRQRQAVVLFYLADTPVTEIASIAGVAEGTVKSWLHRARTALAGHLSEDETPTTAGGARD